jgi:aromatic-L-amino-acid decarboxylase
MQGNSAAFTRSTPISYLHLRRTRASPTSSLSPELTRDFRGLRLWLPLHLHGTNRFVEALDQKLDLAGAAYEELSAIPELVVPWAPELSLVAFRTHGSDEDTTALLGRINASGRIWLSSAVFRGHTYLRMCILSHRSHPQRIREGLQIIRENIA